MGDDEARHVLLSGIEGRPLREPLPLRFTTGRRRLSWNKNCVAIGLSAGFLEPLESTGIHMIQRGAHVLAGFFPDRTFRQPDIDAYNRRMAFEYERIRDFLVAHYCLTRREGEFWRYCREMALPDSLQERLELFRGYGRIIRDPAELFSEQSWFFMLTGQGVRPAGYDPRAQDMTAADMRQIFQRITEVVARCAATMPAHQDFIAQNCAAPAVE
jgi:tryptophan halogenase